MQNIVCGAFIIIALAENIVYNILYHEQEITQNKQTISQNSNVAGGKTACI